MKPISELLNQDAFLKSMFHSIPCGMLIVDKDRRVRAVNNVVEKTFGAPLAQILNRRGGEALKCIYASKSPEGCGFADECKGCQVRNTALNAISGEKVFCTWRLPIILLGNISRGIVLLIGFGDGNGILLSSVTEYLSPRPLI